MTLTYFTPLSKWGNIIDGEINPSLTDLKHLSHLDLRFNNFEGIPIPKFTGSLHMLHYLDLSNANFSGMIHDEIGNLSNLHYPDISGVLTSLWVRFLQSSYSPSIYSIWIYHITGNPINSSIPSWLFNLSNLTHLYVSERSPSCTSERESLQASESVTQIVGEIVML